MTESAPDLLRDYGYGEDGALRALGEPSESAPLVVVLASERWQHLNGLFLSLGGDKLSIWDRAHEVRCAFNAGGWSSADLDRSIEFALGSDLNAGWNVWQPEPSPR
jgi:hypothetical protein